MYEEKLMNAAKLEERPKHIEFAEVVVKELLQFNPEQQNEIIKFWRHVSIEERKSRIDQIKLQIQELMKESEYLAKSCEVLS